MANQGVFTFPGLESNLGAEMVLHRGITPSVATVWVNRRQQIDLTVGTMQFSYGADTPVKFSGSVPGVAHLKQDIEFWKKPVIQKVMIYDRRINWTKGVIRGNYNIRRADGVIDTSTKLNAKELVNFCLFNLGESGYDTSLVPTGIYPYVDWNTRHTSPGHALASICELVSCTINLVNDVVIITPYGTGAAMPGATRRATQDVDVYPKTKPATIRVVGSPTRFQSRLKLGARALDSDGTRQTLAAVSYKPATGWQYAWPMSFAGVAIANRRYAFDTVFRWYQIQGQADGTLPVPSCSETISSIDQYIPIYQYLLTGTLYGASGFNAKTPYIEGIYWPRHDHPVNTSVSASYTGDFTLDPYLGMVRLNQPCFKINTGGLIEEAELYLIAAYSVSKTTGGKVRVERTTALPAGGVGELVLSRPELFHAYIQYPSTSDNTAAVNAEADAYLTAFAARYAIVPVKDAEYDGFPISGTDGLIAQITFSVGRNRVATSRVSQNEEMNIYSPDFKDRRRRELVEAAL